MAEALETHAPDASQGVPTGEWQRDGHRVVGYIERHETSTSGGKDWLQPELTVECPGHAGRHCALHNNPDSPFCAVREEISLIGSTDFFECQGELDAFSPGERLDAPFEIEWCYRGWDDDCQVHWRPSRPALEKGAS